MNEQEIPSVNLEWTIVHRWNGVEVIEVGKIDNFSFTISQMTKSIPLYNPISAYHEHK